MIYSIGQLSKKTNCKVPTIRYYEEIGLLDKAQRSAGNQRQYTDHQYQSLQFICHCRSLGFSLEEVRELLHLRHCQKHKKHQADDIVVHHLKEVRQKIEQLQSLEEELLTMVHNCKTSESEDCLVLKSLNQQI